MGGNQSIPDPIPNPIPDPAPREVVTVNANENPECKLLRTAQPVTPPLTTGWVDPVGYTLVSSNRIKKHFNAMNHSYYGARIDQAIEKDNCTYCFEINVVCPADPKSQNGILIGGYCSELIRPAHEYSPVALNSLELAYQSDGYLYYSRNTWGETQIHRKAPNGSHFYNQPNLATFSIDKITVEITWRNIENVAVVYFKKIDTIVHQYEFKPKTSVLYLYCFTAVPQTQFELYKCAKGMVLKEQLPILVQPTAYGRGPIGLSDHISNSRRKVILNILLLGKWGAGKSRFINTALTALDCLHRYVNMYGNTSLYDFQADADHYKIRVDAVSRPSGEQVTRAIEEIPKELSRAKYIRFLDSYGIGLVSNVGGATYFNEKFLKPLLWGHLNLPFEEESKFDAKTEDVAEYKDSSNWKKSPPALQDRVHAVVFAVDSTTVYQQPAYLNEVNLLSKKIRDCNHNMRCIVILTKIDQIKEIASAIPLDASIEEKQAPFEISNVFQNRAIAKIIKYVSQKASVEVENIYPIQSYTNKQRSRHVEDLVLYALDGIAQQADYWIRLCQSSNIFQDEAHPKPPEGSTEQVYEDEYY